MFVVDDQLERRVKRFEVRIVDGAYQGRLAATFGDTGPDGALRVVESIWGDPLAGRLLIAEEDETYANEIKICSLDGRYAGLSFGRERFAAQAEGIVAFDWRDIARAAGVRDSCAR